MGQDTDNFLLKRIMYRFASPNKCLLQRLVAKRTIEKNAYHSLYLYININKSLCIPGLLCQVPKDIHVAARLTHPTEGAVLFL